MTGLGHFCLRVKFDVYSYSFYNINFLCTFRVSPEISLPQDLDGLLCAMVKKAASYLYTHTKSLFPNRLRFDNGTFMAQTFVGNMSVGCKWRDLSNNAICRPGAASTKEKCGRSPICHIISCVGGHSAAGERMEKPSSFFAARH